MTDYREASNKDIARQFDLPERQSKIATLLKQNDEYCICRSTDSTRFMIACDNCEEWYHGDCIGVTEKDSNNIKKYFCDECQSRNPTLKVVYKSRKPPPLHPTNKDRGGRDKLSDKRAKPGRPKKNETTKESRSKERSKEQRSKEARSKEARVKESERKESRFKEPRSKGEGKHRKDDRSSAKHHADLHKASSTTTPVKKSRVKRNWNPPSGSSDDDSECGSGQRQCYGPSCTEEARPSSKYCSDACGIKLASARIYRVLPSRVHEWSLTPSIAEQRNKSELEEVRRKQQGCRKAIQELEKRRKKLDDHIAYAEGLRLDPNDEEMEQDEEGVTYCITCGHEVSMKTCIKHMEKCYNKVESQTSFASIAKTNVEGIPIFCDFYNSLNNTYCKRLKVLCPEHSREPKIKDDELCGCPLVKNVFEETDEVCRVAKKKCNRHFCWEKLQRAEIDMERVRQWLKLDELLEEEKALRRDLTNRAGVMGLLLHSTFDYDNVPP